MNIESLIIGLKQGKEEAFKKLVFTYSARLLTVARIYSASDEDAKDMLQDAFILVFKKVGKFEGSEERAFFGWMKRIIINLCLSRSQKRYLKLEKSLDTLVVDPAINETAISKLSHDEIMELVFNLPDGYRQVFALFAIEGYSHKEVAERLSIGESSSRSQYLRARRILQNKITKLFKVIPA